MKIVFNYLSPLDLVDILKDYKITIHPDHSGQIIMHDEDLDLDKPTIVCNPYISGGYLMDADANGLPKAFVEEQLLSLLRGWYDKETRPSV